MSEEAPPTGRATPALTQAPGERRAVILVIAALVAFAISRGALKSDQIWFFAAVVPAIILHEVSHGVVANMLGDDTAKRAGRLTLNPIAHVDLFGTLLMPAMLVFAGVRPIGFAKPVPVNVSRLRSPRNHSVLVSLAGPATNITLAAIAALAFHFFTPTDAALTEFVFAFGTVNVLLATFNLLPIPPLDGSALIERLMPDSWWPTYLKLRRYSMPVLILIVFAVPGVIEAAYDPLIRVCGSRRRVRLLILVGHARHLISRFFGALRPGGPPAADDDWATSHLLPREVVLWRQMPGFDRRHAIGVARRCAALLGGGAPREVMAAALLHDVGKIESGFGVFARVAATLWTGVRGRERVVAGTGRLASYANHPEVGADLLRTAGADDLTVAWAAEHHLPERAWTVDAPIGAVLKAADDD